MIVIGGGPAGLSAAVYAARSGVSVCLVEEYGIGGTCATVSQISNYPGYASISGFELAKNMYDQAVGFGAHTEFGKVEKLQPERRTVTLNGDEYAYKALVLAMGNTPRKLGLPREDELLGQGVSYCATCDGNFFKGKTVAVAGAGSYAYEAAEYLSGLAERVYHLNGGESRGAGGNIIENARITELIGTPLSGIKYIKDGKTFELQVSGLFVELGYLPATRIAKGVVATDERGFITTDECMRTSVDGIFAAGDVRRTPLRQVVTAAADGAVAGTYAAAYAKKVRVKSE